MTELSRNRPFGPDTHQDWAPYSDLVQAAEAYLRDPAIALEALYRVMDPPRSRRSSWNARSKRRIRVNRCTKRLR